MGVAREQVRPADPCSGQDYRVAKTRFPEPFVSCRRVG